jgi:excisionase family DNA binding protein
LSKVDVTEKLLRISDVARLCGVSDRTVRRWIDSGRLVARKLGSQWRIHPRDYAAFLHDAARADLV